MTLTFEVVLNSVKMNNIDTGYVLFSAKVITQKAGRNTHTNTHTHTHTRTPNQLLYPCVSSVDKINGSFLA